MAVASTRDHHDMNVEGWHEDRDPRDVDYPEVVRPVAAYRRGARTPGHRGGRVGGTFLEDPPHGARIELPSQTEERLGDLLLAAEAGGLHLTGQASRGVREATQRRHRGGQPVSDRLGGHEKAVGGVLDREEVSPHVLEDAEPELWRVVRSAAGLDGGAAAGEDVGPVAGLVAFEAHALEVHEEPLRGGAVLADAVQAARMQTVRS